MSDTALAIAAGLLSGLTRGMEQRHQRKREKKQDERADKALKIQRNYYLLAKERSDREIAALDREIAAAKKYGYGSVEELETERKFLMAENERIRQDAMLFEKEHRDELLALEKREREARIAASQESILSSRESRANASEERQYRRRVMKQSESAQNFDTIAKQLSDILRTHPVSAEVEGQIRDALASGDPAQAQAALQSFTRKAPGDLFSPLQASHMASEKERREGEESGQRQSAIQHLSTIERLYANAIDEAVANEDAPEKIAMLRDQHKLITAALMDKELTDPMAQSIIDRLSAEMENAAKVAQSEGSDSPLWETGHWAHMKELAGVEPGDSELVALGKVMTPPMLTDLASGLKNDPGGTLTRLGAKAGFSVMGLPGTLLADEIVDVMQDPERRNNLSDPKDALGYASVRLGAKAGTSVFGLLGKDLEDAIVDVMLDPERRQKLLDRVDDFINPQPILSYDDVIRMDPADRDKYISTVLAHRPLLDEDAISSMTLRAVLFGDALPKSYGAVSRAARGAMAAKKPSPALPGNSQPGQLPAPSQAPLLGYENVIKAGPPPGHGIGPTAWEYPFKGPSTFAPSPAGTPPLALPAPPPQGSVIPLPSRFPAQGIPPVPSNIDLESIIQALSRDWGHRGGAQF